MKFHNTLQIVLFLFYSSALEYCYCKDSQSHYEDDSDLNELNKLSDEINDNIDINNEKLLSPMLPPQKGNQAKLVACLALSKSRLYYDPVSKIYYIIL